MISEGVFKFDIEMDFLVCLNSGLKSEVYVCKFYYIGLN